MISSGASVSIGRQATSARGALETVPPSAADSTWPPKQIPSTGTEAECAAARNSISSRIQRCDPSSAECSDPEADDRVGVSEIRPGSQALRHDDLGLVAACIRPARQQARGSVRLVLEDQDPHRCVRSGWVELDSTRSLAARPGGRAPPVGVPSIASTASMPSITSPNTVCLPSSHGAASVVTMKNCEPLVFGPGVGHRQRAADDLVVVELVLERVAGAAGAGALRAAALDHEVRDHAVEDEAVVEAVAGELAEVLDGLRARRRRTARRRSCRGSCACWLCSSPEATPLLARAGMARRHAGHIPEPRASAVGLRLQRVERALRRDCRRVVPSRRGRVHDRLR